MPALNSQLNLLGKITPIVFFCLLVLSLGVCRTVYKKSYNLQQEYAVQTGETMLYFSRARIKEFQSGIPHTSKLLDYDSITYLGLDHNRLLFRYDMEMADGKYRGYRKDLTLEVPPAAGAYEISLAGFRVKVLQATPRELKYVIIRERGDLDDDDFPGQAVRKISAFVVGDENKEENAGKQEKRKKLKY